MNILNDIKKLNKKRLYVCGIVGTILAVTLITFFSGCSRQRSPSETVKSYFTALAEGNVSEVKQCLSSDSLISWEKIDGNIYGPAGADEARGCNGGRCH